MLFGTGAFAHSTMQILQDNGAEVSCYLTNDTGHFGASLLGKTWMKKDHPSPIPLIQKWKPDVIIPMSIDWHNEPWATQLTTPIFCPSGDAIKIERDRNFASQLCKKFNIAYSRTYLAKDKSDALRILKNDPRGYVIKNPLSSPKSPIRVTVCKTAEETYGWLHSVDFSEGALLQECIGEEEVAHFTFVSNGSIQSIMTHWEYKRAFTGNMGPIAGAPLGSIVEQDVNDKYGLLRELILPLQPWLEETNFCGILSVSAVKTNNGM